MQEEIYNWVGGEHMINQDQCAVSLILSRDGGHAYILIEYLDKTGCLKAFEAHLGTTDEKYSTIRTRDTNLDRLKDIAKNNKARTWSITREEKDQLLHKILKDQDYYSRNEVPYVKIGVSKISGIGGDVLDKIGSMESKEASIEKNHQSLLEHDGFFSGSAQLSHDSIDALLRSGPNCITWAKGRVQTILGSRYQETTLEKVAECIVVDPSIVVANKSSCTLL